MPRPLRPASVLATVALLVGPLAACSPQAGPAASGQGSITVAHAQGEATLPAAPKRVVVMDMGSLDTINALGLADTVVGLPKGNVPAFLSRFADAKYGDVGTLAEPNYEAINALKPDLVVIGYRSAKTYAEMSKYFPTVDVTPKNKEFLGGVEESARIIGAAYGKNDQVTAKMADLRAQASTIAGKGAEAGSGLIVMTSGGKVSAHGAGSRFGAIHSLLGVKPVAEINADSHGEPISFEYIAEKNPDHLFVVDRDAAIGEKGAAAKEVLDNPVVAGSKAWQQGKVTYLDGQRWYITIHGLDNAAKMLAEVGAGLGL